MEDIWDVNVETPSTIADEKKPADQPREAAFATAHSGRFRRSRFDRGGRHPLRIKSAANSREDAICKASKNAAAQNGACRAEVDAGRTDQPERTMKFAQHLQLAITILVAAVIVPGATSAQGPLEGQVLLGGDSSSARRSFSGEQVQTHPGRPLRREPERMAALHSAQPPRLPMLPCTLWLKAARREARRTQVITVPSP